MMRRWRQGDESLLREAFAWDANTPRWYREMDAVFNEGGALDLISKLDEKTIAFFGLFDPSLYAVIIVEMKAGGQFEGHLMATRGANLELIGAAIQSLLHDLLDLGLKEACVWIAEKHRSVRKLCASIGFEPDGVVMWRGSYHGRMIKWVRYSIQREQLLMQIAA